VDHCPNLTDLTVDWQEELAWPPFKNYDQQWFAAMVNDSAWTVMRSRLKSLNVVLPSTHYEGAYSLTLPDFGRMLGVGEEGCPELTHLRLSGAGKHSPIPLLDILTACPNLCELELLNTAVHVPDNQEIVAKEAVNECVRVFHFVGEMHSLLVNDFLTKCVATYMPFLENLELQPEFAIGYPGMAAPQVKELAKMPRLEKLSLPLSIRDFECNMPLLIFLLRDFQCLRHLTLAWSRWTNSYDASNRQIVNMMSWLHQALQAENADVNLQLCYKLHPSFFA